MKTKLKLKPNQWTHHHTHRLYHMSIGVCFSFITLALVAGMSTYWLNANAGTVTDTKNVTVTAQVGGVNPGPVEDGQSGSRPPQPPTGNLNITLQAEPVDQVTRRNITVGGGYVSAYVLPTVGQGTARPAFSGTTSVANGLIFLTIEGPQNLNTTALANAQGNWYWSSVDLFRSGIYAVTATVFDSYDLTRSTNIKAYFIVPSVVAPVEPTVPGEPSQPGTQPGGGTGEGQAPEEPDSGMPPIITPPQAGDLLFGLFYQIPAQSKVVSAGGKVTSWVSLVSNDDKQLTDQVVEYQVISPEGKVVVETKDSVSFIKQAQFTKTFGIAPLTPAGKYTVKVTSTYKGISSVASDSFTVKEDVNLVGSVKPQGPIVIWSLLIMLLLVFLVLVYAAYKYVRHHTNEINSSNITS